jgi:predicted MFS family arabinose efflux permease
VLATVWRFVAETPRRRERFDLTGAALAIAGSVSIVWGLIGAPDHGWTSTRTLVALIAGVVLMAALALNERRVTFPLLSPALMRDRRRVGALLVTTAVFGGQFAMFFLGAQYVQRVLGLSPLAAGAAFLPMTAGILAISRVGPRLVARFGQRALLLAGTVGLIACFAWLSNADQHSGYWTAVFGPVLLNGLAAGLTFMPAASLVVGGVAPEQAGAASGILQTLQQLGGAIGLAVVASVYASGAMPGQFVPGFDAALLTCSGFAALSLLAALLVVPGRSLPRPTARVLRLSDRRWAQNPR